MDSSGMVVRLSRVACSALVNKISPVMRACGGRRRMMAREVIDLPEPDSPTRPRTSPAAMVKVRSRTASKAWADVCGFTSRSDEARPFDLARNSMLSWVTLSRGGTRLW